MSETPVILLVDDEPMIVQMLQDILILAHFRLLVAYDARTALQLAQQNAIDLALLDIELPDMDGKNLLIALKSIRPDLVCLFVSGKDTESDVVSGLELGAEDYITKPFRPRELVARIKKALTHRQVTAEEASARVTVPLQVDELARTVSLYGKDVELTRIEFDLLCLLKKHPNQVFTRAQILNHLWPQSLDTSTRVVDTHIKHLRQKLADNPRSPSFIHTVRGVGYTFGKR